MKTRIRFFLLLFAWFLASSLSHAQEPLAIENSFLIVRLETNNTLSILQKAEKRTVLKNGAFNGSGGKAKISRVRDKQFGPGQAIEISYADGNADTITLFSSLPFVLIRATVHNNGTEIKVLPKIETFSATADLGKPADELKTLGTGGLLTPDKNPGSYAWFAVAEPETRSGLIFGWLTDDRGSGVLFSETNGDSVGVKAQIDYGRLRIHPGETEALETLAVGYFPDARLGLEAWADVVAKVYNIHLPPQPTGYCTWYSQPNGGASDEKHIAELAAFASTNLAPYGFSVVQIDDKWQAGWKRSNPSSPKKNFTTHDPKGPYPSGMKAAADKIKSVGLVPGIWFMPFAGTIGDPFFDQHLDWFVKTIDGKPYDTPWGGTCLDMTHPGARAHLKDVAGRICREWGYNYIKVDGLWTGTATKQMYVNSGYKEDGMGDAVFHNPDKTNIEAYRDGLKLLRETVGRNVFILGCNGPQNMRSYGGAMGLVDGMRIGPDNKADWKSLLRGPTYGSRHYFLHGRVWYNDPDPVYVRASIPTNHAQLICSWVNLSGQLNLSSEWLPGLPPDRLDILRRTMPNHGVQARPVDLFENDLPRIWLVTDAARTVRRDVIGLFNWESADREMNASLEQIGLNPTTEYVAFDFWQNSLVPTIKSRLQINVPSESCRVLAIRPRSNHPQLISTSRHVTQGIVDVLDEVWDEKRETLRGRSKVVGGDDYELRVVSNRPATGISVSANSKKKGPEIATALSHDGKLVRAVIKPPTSGEIYWAIKF